MEFDGKQDAKLKPKDEKGYLFVEYIKDLGTFKKVPYYRIALSWVFGYGWGYVRSLFKKTKA